MESCVFPIVCLTILSASLSRPKLAVKIHSQAEWCRTPQPPHPRLWTTVTSPAPFAISATSLFKIRGPRADLHEDASVTRAPKSDDGAGLIERGIFGLMASPARSQGLPWRGATAEIDGL